tara:strand:+ start:8860 stop:9039 length:180 start_codon:yes stop_codon:yes gene_type:complete
MNDCNFIEEIRTANTEDLKVANDKLYVARRFGSEQEALKAGWDVINLTRAIAEFEEAVV